MSDGSQIEWTDATWNPSTGCTKVSPGCAHCYIERTPAFRIHGRKFVRGATDVLLHENRLEQPLHWKKPRRIFVNSLSDLFHEDIPCGFIYDVFCTMAATPQHTYQVLTKRPERMREFCSRIGYIATEQLSHLKVPGVSFWPNAINDGIFTPRPLPNVWLGVTTENQRFADERIPILLDTPAAVRFVSVEPMIGPVDFEILEHNGAHGFVWPALSGEWAPDDARPHNGNTLDWVIVGGESGPRHRPFDPKWARNVVSQCRDAGVACFVKQLGGARPGNRLEDLPEDLRVREFPR